MPASVEPAIAYGVSGLAGVFAPAIVAGTGGDPTVGLIVAGVVLVVVGTAFFVLRRRSRRRSRSR